MVIPAKDEAERIGATVASAATIPGVDLVVMVDDGSRDDTAARARQAGAVVTRHPRNRGKGAAMQTGAATVARLEAEGRHDGAPRALLFVDADLAETAAACAPLTVPVLAGEVDMTIAVLPPQKAAGGRGRVVRTARAGIEAATGFSPRQPLSGMRAFTRAAFEAALPLAPGWGVETGLTIDVLRAGLTVREIPCDLRHRPSPATFTGARHRAAQLRDVLRALHARGVLVPVVRDRLSHRGR